ncbi:T6SS component TssM (IcmF/VasK) [Cupriavidus sp. U2]|uniref:ImcF-related family protein n=1 Tax=Cupriavidus sp. U2 TaxID=2920269 RepID=UPI00129D99E0|nr:ImcF-related family protein [Cupriavidus sp. U2]KAI3589165.1 T6SS component TssM (IcmF/VasK) [Cupriavidus sp. U2]
MKKLRIDVLSILVIALLVGGAILVWGKDLGIETAERRGEWLSGVAFAALLLAIVVSFQYGVRWTEAIRHVRDWLNTRQSSMADTTQAALAPKRPAPPRLSPSLATLRDALRHKYGLRWRYRQPWMLLVDADAGAHAIAGALLPELKAQGWLMTPDAVLVLAQYDEDGQPDITWLRQFRRLRRWRPLDALVMLFDGHTPGALQGRQAQILAAWRLRIADVLRWSAPIFAMQAGQTIALPAAEVPLVGCEIPERADASDVDVALHVLRHRLACWSLSGWPMDVCTRHLGQLSQDLGGQVDKLIAMSAAVAGHARQRMGLRGIVFVPVPDKSRSIGTAADLSVWQHIAEVAQRRPGRRAVWHPLTAGGGLVLAGIGIWTAGMMFSSLQTDTDIRVARQAVRDMESASDAATRLNALDVMQQQIARYAYRASHHPPVLMRFGMNRDAEVLAALMQPYAKASREILIRPVVRDLEASLADLSRLPTAGLSDETSNWALAGHDALKAYLMLAHPERTDPAFLAGQLARHWSTDARIGPALKQDYGERFSRFFVEHLRANPEWRIAASAELIHGARQTLLAVMGERNAVDTIYRNMIEGVGNKYPDQTLASLAAGTDTRGLLRSDAVVPGVFTRQAFEGYVAGAMEKAATEQDVAGDWTLAVGQQLPAGKGPDGAPAEIRKALADRYFADYAEHWQQFMNGLQWEPVRTLPGVADQLKLMADARQSPVMALMRALEYQGGAGTRSASLSDTLVNKTREILSGNDPAPVKVRTDPDGPLHAAFGPVMRLVDPSRNAGSGELSLQRFMDRVTAVRLHLQQIAMASDAEAQARQMAQALFQGKTSELADTQAYAQRMAASLGAQWAGMGNALFVRPIAQASQAIVQPAQASLNESWRLGVATAWTRSFAGRYPFFDTENDASLPELARFLRPQGGLIPAFLSTQLAGVLELRGDEWVPTTTGGQSLAFDPEFLRRINTLQRIATHMLAQGEPRYRFHLKPIPTPGLTDTLLIVDNRPLHYFNQKESWMSMRWPSDNLQDPGTRLQWQTETAGTSKNHEFAGAWGFVRMLERASVTPVDSATFQLSWQAVADAQASPLSPAPSVRSVAESGVRSDGGGDNESLSARLPRVAAPADMTYPIRYLLRSEVGHGPLEMLWLRNFVLPSRIFTDQAPASGGAPASRA